MANAHSYLQILQKAMSKMPAKFGAIVLNLKKQNITIKQAFQNQEQHAHHVSFEIAHKFLALFDIS